MYVFHSMSVRQFGIVNHLIRSWQIMVFFYKGGLIWTSLYVIRSSSKSCNLHESSFCSWSEPTFGSSASFILLTECWVRCLYFLAYSYHMGPLFFFVCPGLFFLLFWGFADLSLDNFFDRFFLAISSSFIFQYSKKLSKVFLIVLMWPTNITKKIVKHLQNDIAIRRYFLWPSQPNSSFGSKGAKLLHHHHIRAIKEERKKSIIISSWKS